GDLIHGKVPAQARGGAGEIELVEAEALVRPLIPDARFIEHGYGTPFYSPEEYRRMRRDDQNFSRRYEENRQKIQDYLRGVEIHVIYSNDNPLDSVAVEGPVIFVEDRAAEVYRSQVIENPTWLEVCRLANKMMETTGDLHHNFLEDIYRQDLEIDGIPVYRFSTGS
ncbi:MAG: hypothetical protein KDA74_24110, partial [Planctomycetaceae bacterium]|nr:hypothetical protein [Planctomycetaceae bacterium]